MSKGSRRRRCVLLFTLLVPAVLAIAAALFVYTSAGPSLACLSPAAGPAPSGISSHTLLSGGTRRCYLLYLPVGADPGRPLPVVLALHGFAGNANSLREIAVWEPVADREQFVVAYPEGSSFPLRWNIGPVANIPTVDDVQFIADVIADLSHVANVDPARVYVTGFSNGGQMTHHVACRLADRVAAVGVVDGLDRGMLAPCSPARPVQVMAFFGSDNPLAGAEYPRWFQKLVNVSVEPGPPLSNDAIRRWIALWAEQDGCPLAAEPLPPTGNAGGIRYGGCRGGAEVVLYEIEGQGHAWPGGPSLPGLGASVSDVNASELLWAFFEAHPLLP